MDAATLADIPLIDVDTHVVEPPDLWTSRMPAKFGEQIPRVRWDDKRQDEGWFLGDARLGSAGSAGQAGWPEYPPKHPPRYLDADVETRDATRRLDWMDRYGIRTAVLYPNVAMFAGQTVQKKMDPAARLAQVQAYNDYQTEFAASAPGRYVAVTSLPFWDLDATLAEIDRCAALDHRGINFTQDPTAFGLPGLTDPHWDPMWASMQEKGLPVNFHIASGDTSLLERSGHQSCGAHANYASMGVSFFMGNARTIAQLICGGICHRFPGVNFVSVESGIGWLPFAVAALDWQWKNCGVGLEHPEYDLLPSEYFRRQIYGCFWFERETAVAAIEQLGADNFLFETDFPHPTSQSPGTATSAIEPNRYVLETFAHLPDATLRKILHDNAARLYRLP
jgi:predicted TIM-barrel fold metal-dependent hydrolase